MNVELLKVILVLVRGDWRAYIYIIRFEVNFSSSIAVLLVSYGYSVQKNI